MPDSELTQTKIDVEVLKEQISQLSRIVTKLEGVVDKLNDAHEVQLQKFEADIRTISARVDAIAIDLRATEKKLEHDIEMCKASHTSSVENIQSKVNKFDQYKWIGVGILMSVGIIFGKGAVVQLLSFLK